MAKKVAYIYVFTLSIGGKPIAKYAGRHSFTPDHNEVFDTTYLGSGTCWTDLRNEFGFNDGNTWRKKAANSFEFMGTHGAVFTGRAAYPINEVGITDSLEANIIEAMVQSEGLNMDIINKFRIGRCELDTISAIFIEEHKNILGGKGLFVNQRPGGSSQALALTKQARIDRAENSALQFMVPSDKAKFINGEISMRNKAMFIHKDGSHHEHMLAHVYGAAQIRMGYTFAELILKMSSEEAKAYDESQKLLLIQSMSRNIAKIYSYPVESVRDILKAKAKDVAYTALYKNRKKFENSFVLDI